MQQHTLTETQEHLFRVTNIILRCGGSTLEGLFWKLCMSSPSFFYFQTVAVKM